MPTANEKRYTRSLPAQLRSVLSAFTLDDLIFRIAGIQLASLGTLDQMSCIPEHGNFRFAVLLHGVHLLSCENRLEAYKQSSSPWRLQRFDAGP